MSNNSSATSGASFFELLFIVFLILKLTHVIDWSWWWVTAPLWIGAIIAIIAIVIILIIKSRY